MNNRDIFITDANRMLISMAPHVAQRKTAKMLHEAVTELDRSCQWKFDNDGYYQTTCGNGWSFDDGGIPDNGVNYCPYCGGKVFET